ncbi:MAG: hypothetical protein E7378_03920 [Clostridiales bacterium]|nr:hypothetical protein [Clostridiales bacterium]
MTPQTVSLIINILFGAFIIFGFLYGLKGLKKSLYDFVFFILSLVAVFFLVTPVSNLALKISIGGTTIGQSIADAVTSSLGQEMAGSEIATTLSQNIPVLIANIVVSILLIAILGIIFKIISAIVYKVANRKNKDKVVEKCTIVNGVPQMTKETIIPKKRRLLGGVVGAVKGFVLVLALFLPAMGLVNIASDISGANTVSAEAQTQTVLPTTQDLLQENIPYEVIEYAKALNNSLLAKLGRVGGVSEFSLNSISRCTINGQTIKLGEELRTVANAYNNLATFVNERGTELETDNINDVFQDIISNSTAEEFDQIETILNDLFKSNLLNAVGNDAMIIAIDMIIEDYKNPTNAEQQITLDVLNCLKKALVSYDKCGYVLKDDIIAVLNLVEVVSNNGLLEQFTAEELNIQDVIATLIKYEDYGKGQIDNTELKNVCNALTNSNLLQKILIEATNYGTIQLENYVNNNVEFEAGHNLNISQLDSSQNITLSSSELSNLLTSVYKIYYEAEQLNLKDKKDAYEILESDLSNIIEFVGEGLENLFTIDIVENTNILTSFCDSMSNSEYATYVSFDEIVSAKNIHQQITNVGLALAEVQNSDLIEMLKNSHKFDWQELTSKVIDELRTTDTSGKALSERILTPLLQCTIAKNAVEYGFDSLKNFLETSLNDFAQTEQVIAMSDFNTPDIKLEDGRLQIITLANQILPCLQDFDFEMFMSDNLADSLLNADLSNIGKIFDVIKESSIFASNGTGEGVYKDAINILSNSVISDFLDLSIALNNDFSWEEEMSKIETVAQNLQNITIGETTQTALDYIIENFDDGLSVTTITTALNKDRFVCIKPLFESNLTKPTAITVLNLVNAKIQKELGIFGAGINNISNTANIAYEADTIINVFATATDLGFNFPEFESIEIEKINALLDALNANTNIYANDENNNYGVFKDVYNAINNKLAATIIEGIHSITNKAPSTLSNTKNLLSQANDVKQVLNIAVDIIPQIKEDGLKIGDMTQELKTSIVELLDTLQNNSVKPNSVFEDSYNSLVEYFAEENNISVDFINENFKDEQTGLIDWEGLLNREIPQG